MSSLLIPHRCSLCHDDPRHFRGPFAKSARLDLTGQQFDRLRVEHFLGIGSSQKSMWCCRCLCGGSRVVRGGDLQSGRTRSCGCRYKDAVNAHRFPATHRQTHSREYTIWIGMRQRCTNPTVPDYPRYGGRGIQVCEQWATSFPAFYADMGPAPPTMSLDRIDNNGHYAPENCRWATSTEQQNNKRDNRMYTWQTETQTLTQWAVAYDMPYDVVWRRITRGKWSLEQALTIPVRPKKSHKTPGMVQGP